jgi:hypothetical protein
LEETLETETIPPQETYCPPINKCPHGVYIAAGETTARYCSGCNPDGFADTILLRTMARRRTAHTAVAEERTLDAADFLNQSPAARIAASKEFLNL